ncbi:MAG: GNAT family protein [Verrucomicrobiota bacterium]|nr:GNAT family protein [Verrucomicrobiota bacterium]
MPTYEKETSQPTLNTRRLCLRPFSTEDASRVEEYCGDHDVAATTANIPHPYPPGTGELWILTLEPSFIAGNSAVFAITLQSSGELVGACGLTHNRDHKRAELGYWIGKVHWGEGYATEAAAAVIDWGFRAWNLNRIHAHHMSHNPASGRVMVNNSMKHEGILRQHMVKWDQPVDVVCYAILREEWAGRKPAE